MARKLVPIATISHYAVTTTQAYTTSTAANGWVVLNDGATFLVFDNSASSISTTFTITVTQGFDVNLTVGPRTYTIGGSAIPQFTGFFPIKTYGGQLLVTASNDTPGIAAYSFSATGAQDF